MTHAPSPPTAASSGLWSADQASRFGPAGHLEYGWATLRGRPRVDRPSRELLGARIESLAGNRQITGCPGGHGILVLNESSSVDSVTIFSFPAVGTIGNRYVGFGFHAGRMKQATVVHRSRLFAMGKKVGTRSLRGRRLLANVWRSFPPPDQRRMHSVRSRHGIRGLAPTPRLKRTLEPCLAQPGLDRHSYAAYNGCIRTKRLRGLPRCKNDWGPQATCTVVQRMAWRL